MKRPRKPAPPYIQAWKENVYAEFMPEKYIWDAAYEEWFWKDWHNPNTERLRLPGKRRTLPETWFRFIELDSKGKICWACAVRAESFEEAEKAFKKARLPNIRRDGMFSIGGRLVGKASTFDKFSYAPRMGCA